MVIYEHLKISASKKNQFDELNLIVYFFSIWKLINSWIDVFTRIDYFRTKQNLVIYWFIHDKYLAGVFQVSFEQLLPVNRQQPHAKFN